MRFGRLRWVMIAALGILVSGCANNYPTRVVSYKETPIERPAAPLSEAELLTVRVETFDPGALPTDPKLSKGLSPDIRKAEARYIPVQLKNTLQRSEQWGPVRVVPQGMREGEVVVSGKIIESDGEYLKLTIDVKDAAGVQWFQRDYESVIDAAAYRKAEQGGVDPFQDLYNKIANDIAAHKRALKAEEGATIRHVAGLKFGSEFAPDAYGGYLKKVEVKQAEEDAAQRLVAFFKQGQQAEGRKPLFVVERLPSEEDPIVQRINRIKAREDLLVDTLDQQYDGLARGMGEAYTRWRTSRLKEITAIRESDRAQNEQQAKAVAIGILGALAGAAVASQNRGGSCYNCTTAGVAIAGVAAAVAVQMAVKASEQASAEADLRKAALEELGNSMAADVNPTVIEVEGQTVELRGTVEEKFQKWRAVLKELQDVETAPLRVPEPPPTPIT